MTIADILSKKLKQVEAVPGAEWQVWEHKTLNIHRAVLEWTPGGCPRSYAEISRAIRAQVASRFKVSWWRGMGFGVVLGLASPPEDIASCIDDIDGRENRRGTWQWSILVLPQSRAAIGVHMWMSGYLSEIYEQILSRYEAEGYRVATTKKAKDKLMQFLTLVRPLPEHPERKKQTPDTLPYDGPAPTSGVSEHPRGDRQR